MHARSSLCAHTHARKRSPLPPPPPHTRNESECSLSLSLARAHVWTFSLSLCLWLTHTHTLTNKHTDDANTYEIVIERAPLGSQSDRPFCNTRKSKLLVGYHILFEFLCFVRNLNEKGFVSSVGSTTLSSLLISDPPDIPLGIIWHLGSGALGCQDSRHIGSTQTWWQSELVLCSLSPVCLEIRNVKQFTTALRHGDSNTNASEVWASGPTVQNS